MNLSQLKLHILFICGVGIAVGGVIPGDNEVPGTPQYQTTESPPAPVQYPPSPEPSVSATVSYPSPIPIYSTAAPPPPPSPATAYQPAPSPATAYQPAPSSATVYAHAAAPPVEDTSGRAGIHDHSTSQSGSVDHHQHISVTPAEHSHSTMHPLHPDNRPDFQFLEDDSEKVVYEFPTNVVAGSTDDIGYEEHPKYSSLYPLQPSNSEFDVFEELFPQEQQGNYADPETEQIAIAENYNSEESEFGADAEEDGYPVESGVAFEVEDQGYLETEAESEFDAEAEIYVGDDNEDEEKYTGTEVAPPAPETETYVEEVEVDAVVQEVDTGPSAFFASDGSFSAIKAFDQVISTADGYRKSLTYPMKKFVEIDVDNVKESGHRLLTLCKLGRMRLIIQRAVKNLLETYDHWAKIGTTLEGEHCLEEAMVSLHELVKEIKKTELDLNNIGSDLVGFEPFESLRRVEIVISMTIIGLGSLNRNTQSVVHTTHQNHFDSQ